MTGRWWRAYDEALHDPKLVAVSDKLHRAWFNLLCIASKNDGILPEIEMVAIELRVSIYKAAEWIKELVIIGLIDESETGKFTPHNWEGRQFHSDVSTERVKRFRKRQRNVSETPSETETDTEVVSKKERKQQENEEEAPKGATTTDSKYAFESGIIKLNQRDFSLWKASYSHLDLAAELLGLSEWAGNQRNWFIALQTLLAKKNRESRERIEAEKNKPAFKYNGIEGVL